MKPFRSKPIRLAAALAACALVPATGLVAQSDGSPPRAVTVTANPPQPVARVSVRSAPSCSGYVPGPETNSCGASSACSGAEPGSETNGCGGPGDCSGPSAGPDANSCDGLRDALGSPDDCSGTGAAAPMSPFSVRGRFLPLPAPVPSPDRDRCTYHCQCEASPVADR